MLLLQRHVLPHLRLRVQGQRGGAVFALHGRLNQEAARRGSVAADKARVLGVRVSASTPDQDVLPVPPTLPALGVAAVGMVSCDPS